MAARPRLYRRVLRRATNRTVPAMANSSLWAPLGFGNQTYWQVRQQDTIAPA
jgi:hypothetical protein